MARFFIDRPIFAWVVSLGILLSGFMFPFEGMPRPAQWFAEILPLTHFVRLSRGIMLRGADLSSLWPELLALGVFSAAVLGVAILWLAATPDMAETRLTSTGLRRKAYGLLAGHWDETKYPDGQTIEVFMGNIVVDPNQDVDFAFDGSGADPNRNGGDLVFFLQGTGRRLQILVTHDPVEAAGIADRIIQLEAGRIVAASAL